MLARGLGRQVRRALLPRQPTIAWAVQRASAQRGLSLWAAPAAAVAAAAAPAAAQAAPERLTILQGLAAELHGYGIPSVALVFGVVWVARMLGRMEATVAASKEAAASATAAAKETAASANAATEAKLAAAKESAASSNAATEAKLAATEAKAAAAKESAASANAATEAKLAATEAKVAAAKEVVAEVAKYVAIAAELAALKAATGRGEAKPAAAA